MTPKKKSVSATVTIFVAVETSFAFTTFTEDIDIWWRHGPRYRSGKRESSVMILEPEIGGRLIEKYDGEMFALGQVVAWEPPRRMQLEWSFRNSRPDETTEVEITFEPVDDGTQVTIQHRGVHDLRPDHPALHGIGGAKLSGVFGSWWSDLAQSLRALAEKKSSS